ncbi:hypothetical protein TSUD_286510 [Trifolium subterraneum]|uniref:Uncharacterized protein n=1 Tax=Trifolium subterraneum TaxID=3900 RepID=A0A2Z6PQX5_TRISU|nr:hypothetical protein TSUD_286510 [Trifolium subterraneum]
MVKLLEGVLGTMETKVGWGGEENGLRQLGFFMKEWTGFNEKGVVMVGLKGNPVLGVGMSLHRDRERGQVTGGGGGGSGV